MKQRNLKKKAGSLLLAVAMVVTSFPALGSDVHAAENELPDSTQFATADELKAFNTNDSDGTTNPAKVYFGENNQQWWIAGSQQENGLTLFAASPLATDQVFERNFNQNKTYSEDWNCIYTGENPTEVYANHYGASRLRTKLRGLESSYFTGEEQNLMNDTTIYTNDTKNSRVYSTKEKLYLAYGIYRYAYITVGTNNQQSLSNGLRIDVGYLGNSPFWLRKPVGDISGAGLVAFPDSYVDNRNVFSEYALVPAFELDLSSVLFASAAPAASSDGNLTLADTDGDGAFTLRYSGKDLGSALVSYDKSQVTLTGVPNGTYLVVQKSDGAKAKQITNETEVSASDMGLTDFANCKVWLETTDTANRMTYATMATQANGYNVKVNVGQNMTVTNGNVIQSDVTGEITPITVQAESGYYFTDEYVKELNQRLNSSGLAVTKTDDYNLTITGTPTSDVNITLPAATVLPKADTPIVELKTTSTSITAAVTNHKTEFGAIEYKWNNENWEENSNELLDLTPATKYQLAVRFTGNGFYQQSDEYSIEITTLKDGNTVIVVPTGLTTTYKEGLTLSEVNLSSTDWAWVNGDTTLTAGTSSYPATFDTSDLESTYDFSSVDGYDPDTHKVTRDVQVEVKKADSNVAITTKTLDKVYDRNAVAAPEYTPSGSDGKVTIKWQENTGSVDTPRWEDLKSTPSTVGTYRVVVELAGNANYKPASATLNFVISQTTNAWTEELSITGWTYNEKANVPTAKAQFGDVVFSYSSEENGTYTNEVPKNAGTYYVKATVAGTENYTGLESAPVAFEIAKAIPTYEKVTSLVLGQGQALSKIKLPEQFKWVDETMTADELGIHTFKAIYTPEDTVNYQAIEVEIEVEVVPTPVAINYVPTINASDKTIAVGDKFDPLKDVTANDKEDGDLTSKIKVIKNTVDTKKAEIYEVTYQVTDSQGATVTKTIKVTVKAVPVNPDTDKPNTDKPSNDKGSVETGDRNNLLLWEVLLSGSGIVLLYSLYRKKRKTQ